MASFLNRDFSSSGNESMDEVMLHNLSHFQEQLKQQGLQVSQLQVVDEWHDSCHLPPRQILVLPEGGSLLLNSTVFTCTKGSLFDPLCFILFCVVPLTGIHCYIGY